MRLTLTEPGIDNLMYITALFIDNRTEGAWVLSFMGWTSDWQNQFHPHSEASFAIPIMNIIFSALYEIQSDFTHTMLQANLPELFFLS